MSLLKSASAMPGLRAQSEFPPKSTSGSVVSNGTGAKAAMRRGISSNEGGKLPSEMSKLRSLLYGGGGELEKKLDSVAEFPIPEYADFVKGRQLQTAGVHVLVDTSSPGVRSHLSKAAMKVCLVARKSQGGKR